MAQDYFLSLVLSALQSCLSKQPSARSEESNPVLTMDDLVY